MKHFVFPAAVVALATSTASAQQAVQWRVEDGGNGHWYEREGQPLNWPDAQDRAVAAGGYLVTIRSSAEFQYISTALGLQNDLFWIGGFQPKGSCEPGCGWQWVTNEPWDYTNWNWSEPSNSNGNENWLECYPGGLWNDHGDSLKVSVREWSADCNNDGIVDYGQILSGQLADVDNDGIPDSCEAPLCGEALNEEFEGSTLNPAIWTIKTPFSCSSLQVNQGEALFQGRAQILTQSDFAPTSGGIRLEFGFRYVAGAELFGVSLLTNGNINGTCCGQVNNGLTMYVHMFSDPSTAAGLDASQLSLSNFVRTGSLSATPGDVFDVVIDLNPSTILAVCRKVGTSGETTTLSANWSGDPLGRKIAFFNREFCSTRTALLYVRVSNTLDPAGDVDKDGILNCSDNCPYIANADQSDCNSNGIGDACDWVPDCDGDGVSDDCEIAAGASTDFDSNGVPDDCECLADLSGNGVVNGVDLAAVLSSWGTSGQSELNADINRNGIVNGQDLAFVLGGWGPCP